MPSKDTFDCPPIKDFVSRYLNGGISVDPFARNKKLATWTNDINPETAADYHWDAEDFLMLLHESGVVAECVLLDPPYSPRQISECYKAAGLKVTMKDTQNAVLYKKVRAATRLLCQPGTIVLSFGWNSCGMGDGFEPLEILLVAHGGAHNDTICLAERMVGI